VKESRKIEREDVFTLEVGLRLRYRRSAPPPPYRYAITIEWFDGEAWRTVRSGITRTM
jgi:hypothetical protein